MLGRLPDTAVMADLIGRFDTRLDDDGDDEAASAVTTKSLCSCVRLLVHLQVIGFHDLFDLKCDKGSVVRQVFAQLLQQRAQQRGGARGLDEEDFVRFVQGRDAYGSSPELMDVLRLVMSLSLDDE